MPNFKAPQFTKVINPKTGISESCYIFNVEFTETDTKISYVSDSDSEISLQNIQKCVVDNITWWNTFLTQYLEATSKLFAKHYTVDNINKIAKHALLNKTICTTPSNVILTPKSIQIMGSTVIINWDYILEPIMIDIPDLERDGDNDKTALPVLNENKVIGDMEELNIDDLPVGNNSTEILEVDSPIKFYDRQKIKEARLKAKLAIYRVQRQTAKYYDKYGEDISDSDSESEYDTSDDETRNNSELEEVQV